MTADDLIERLSLSIQKLFSRDSDLFDLGTDGINEQTLTFRLGLYLAGLFPEHNVDCEYNRLWDGYKRCLRHGISWMKPDVVVHIRQSVKANLLCIEAKKESEWKDIDEIPSEIKKKLQALTDPDDAYRYSIGLAWRISTSDQRFDHHAVWFVSGKPVLKTNLRDFEGQLSGKLSEMEVLQ